MTAVTGSGIQDVLNGIASVLWPIVALLAIALFRPEIRSALRRIRELNIFGNSVKFEDELTELQTDSEKLAASPIQPEPPEVPDAATIALAASGAVEAQFTGHAVGVVIPPTPSSVDSDVDAQVHEVLAVSATSPTAALMQLSAQLERLVRRIIAQTGHLGEVRNPGSMRELTDILERAVALPAGSLDALRAFTRVRNEIVHGTTAATDAEVLRAIDSGIVLLRSLHAVPLELNVVEYPGVPIYSDDSGTARLQGKGLILSTTSPGGAVTTRRIFPTTRDHYTRGKVVAWEWSMEHVWPEAWYRDPVTEQMTVAWTSSAEFVGRNLDEI
jgi:hypothetical protein